MTEDKYVMYLNGEVYGEYDQIRHAKASRTQALKRRWTHGKDKDEWVITKKVVTVLSETEVWNSREQA